MPEPSNPGSKETLLSTDATTSREHLGGQHGTIALQEDMHLAACTLCDLKNEVPKKIHVTNQNKSGLQSVYLYDSYHLSAI